MVLKLYGFPQSTATCLAALILVEKQVPFEFVTIDITSKAEQKTPEYLEKHPFGQVPYIVRLRFEDSVDKYNHRALN